MNEPLRPLPPRTALVSNPDARREVEDDAQEEHDAATRRQDEIPAGFLKNVIDKPHPDRKSGP